MTSIKNLLKKYENIALSDKEVLNIINGRAKLILYPELHKYKSIDHLLEPYGACILLYEAKPRYGHWCCVFKVNDKLIEYFNPYGGFHEGFPDKSLEYIPMDFRLKSNQYYPYLSFFMYNSPYDLSYNEYKFQKHNKDIKTCGRWVALRIVFKHLSLDQFYQFIEFLKQKLNMTSDQLVTFLTMYINKI